MSPSADRSLERSSVSRPAPHRPFLLRPALAWSLLAAVAWPAQAQDVTTAPDRSLGVVAFGASCDPAVLPQLDHGVALLHHMTYPAADSVFRLVTERDPECAVGYWGRAMTLFQPLWPTRPGPEELERGWQLVQKARRHVADGSRDAMFVAAGEAFFDPAGDPDYWTRIDRWAAASAAVHEAWPEDLDAAAFHALAQLAAAGRSGDAAADHARAAELLSWILVREPRHPGAVHYTIHANDFTGRERHSLDVVRSYDDIAPSNAHALHMPTHVFVRLGEWDDVIDGNRRAADAALAHRVGPTGDWVWDEYPHAVEYLVYAHLQRGADAEALELIRRLHHTPDLQPSFKTAFHLASTTARYALERQAWEEAARIPARSPGHLAWDPFPWPEAVVWHARGLGAAHTGDAGGVAESLGRLAELSARAAGAGEALFADQIEILRLEVEGWGAFAGGDLDRAVTVLREAVALEGRTPKHPVTPGASIPAEELLGDLYLASGSPAAARDAYRASNARAPGRLNTLAGLARASVALGDVDGARTWYRELLDRAAGSSGRPAVLEARTHLGGG